MAAPRRRPAATELAPGSATAEPWRLSDGEIHYLWWYIQGSIMEPDVRRRLRQAWGMCGRHAWGALAVEIAFRPRFLHGPALLYEDIMGQAQRALDVGGLWPARRLARRLGATGPCLMCEMGLTARSCARGAEHVIAQGRNVEPFLSFVRRRRAAWVRGVCGRCAGTAASARCRIHLRTEAAAVPALDVAPHRALVAEILRHVTAFARSFRWEYRGTETEADEAAVVSAIGWCSGWQPWLPLLLGEPGASR